MLCSGMGCCMIFRCCLVVMVKCCCMILVRYCIRWIWKVMLLSGLMVLLI